MCGIGGIASRRATSTDALRRLSDAIAMRGPDDVGYLLHDVQGTWVGRELPSKEVAGVGLVHRRLSILDLSERGWNPMASPDGRLHIVYNGEVYNFKELRDELRGHGHAFTSETDTEVILAAYRQWGPACLPRFVGMFAFCILDEDDGSLFLARDPFGIKPLNYAAGPGGFAFCSNLPGLLEVPWVSRQADLQRLYAYLSTGHGLSSHDAGTMFRDVRQLPAAHWMRVPLDTLAPTTPTPYWELKPSGPRDITPEAAAAEFRRLFRESVALHLRSDVPVGVCLSGGLDSSSIVCAMREVAGPELDLHTFSYVASNPAISEERWMDLVNARVGATSHKVRIGDDDLADDLRQLVRAQGEPFGNSTIYAQYRVFRLAQEAGIKVMLDGQGADEMLAGYTSYLGSRLATAVRHGDAKTLRRLWKGARARRLPARFLFMATMDRLSHGPLRRAAQRLLRTALEAREDWIDHDWFRAHGVATEAARPFGQADLRGDLVQTVRSTSLPALLRYEDRNSMAHSIESRVPFLTVPIAEFLLSLPPELLLGDDATTKVVLRVAMRGLVPDEVLDRRDKIGFNTTEPEWLQRHAGLLRSAMQRLGEHPAFRSAGLDRLLHQVSSGGPTASAWRAFNVAMWMDEFQVALE